MTSRPAVPAQVLILLLSTSVTVCGQEKPSGEAIFAARCASCHGQLGEGTEEQPDKLFGDQPTADLAEYISQTMPEGEPELCSGEDAQAVAEWMQTAFYSHEAQGRLHPPRTRLSRLTVSQYRNAIADLVEGFTWRAEPDDKQGLTARYYRTRNFRDNDKVIERLDPVVNFDFGEGTPDKEKIPKAEQFSIRWEGSVVIRETGWYDFVIRTENGARLYINDTEKPLIDAWVKSGYDTEYRGSVFLLAGRLYRLNFEWFTFKEKTASVGLWWKPPHGIDEPIPARHLSPQSAPQAVIVETPFPPDDRSDGYIRGTSVSPEWDHATTMAAIEATDKIMALVRQLAKIQRKDQDEQQTEKLKAFCETFAFRAFRRPLSVPEQQTYIDRQFQEADNSESAVRRSLLAILKSPRFLYREITQQHDLFTQAERLSFALIDSVPDPNLLQAAQKQWLNSDKGRRDQAWRLVDSFRGRVRLQEFLRVWMNLERLETLDKDKQRFADFTPQIAADLRTSLELLLTEAASADDGFRYLLSTDQTWLNHRLAAFYGVADLQEEAFQPVKLEPEMRAGVVTHPFLLSGLAYQNTTSPIHRGVFLSRGILGRALKPPPDSVAPLAPDLEPELTTRQRVLKQTSPAVCSNCHKMINALGFALEGFDAVGRRQDTEKGTAIDTSGFYRQRDGQVTEFTGARELAQFLVQSSETHRSFCRQLFHHMVQQPILAYGADSIEQYARFFADHQFNMKHLMVEIACRTAAHPRTRPATTSATEH